MHVRPAEPADLPTLTDLYNHYVRTSHVTFDLEEFTVEQRAEWFAHYSLEGPHRLLVAVEGSALLGYASSSPFRPKPGYRSSVETSVYLDPDATGRGVGSALYTRLLAEVDAEGVHACYAGVAPPNPGSIALHAKFGFREIGTFHEVGRKFGRYIDVQWFERVGGGQAS